MNIQSVETKHITEDPFAGLTETEMEFTPYWTCKLNDGKGFHWGKGETKDAAIHDAVENMKNFALAKIREAIAEYNAEQGVYFVDC